MDVGCGDRSDRASKFHCFQRGMYSTLGRWFFHINITQVLGLFQCLQNGAHGSEISKHNTTHCVSTNEEIETCEDEESDILSDGLESSLIVSTDMDGAYS